MKKIVYTMNTKFCRVILQLFLSVHTHPNDVHTMHIAHTRLLTLFPLGISNLEAVLSIQTKIITPIIIQFYQSLSYTCLLIFCVTIFFREKSAVSQKI